MNEKPTTAEILEIGKLLTRETIARINRSAETDAEIFFRKTKDLVTGKEATEIDKFAEHSFKHVLRYHHPDGRFRNVDFSGEEFPSKKDQGDLACLVDAVDGTDLVIRGLENWCCGSVFYSRLPTPHIYAAFVGTPSGDVYFASDKSNRAYLLPEDSEKAVRVAGPSSVTTLSKATICYYGQKTKNSRSVKPVTDRLAQMKSKDMRIYGLGGMPMMMKLIDHKFKEVAGIDVVFDCHGQKLHDCIPGLYIALKARAFGVNLYTRKELTVEDLELWLKNGKKGRAKYVIASTEALAKRVARLCPE